MDCQSMITDEEIYDFILENNPRIFDINEVTDQPCVLEVDENWSVGYGRLTDNTQLSIGKLGYQTIPKLYGLADTTSLDESGITATLNQPFLDVKGQGVIIGFVDTGIDYKLDVFKYSQFSSKISVLWDQTQAKAKGGDLEEGFPKTVYGRVYSNEEINANLRLENESDSQVLTTDDNGHGTFLAGIAAGAVVDDFNGAAPDAEIAFVKLKPAKKYLRDYYLINEQAVCYEETDIMLGIRFLLEYADMRKLPLVICFGLETPSGSRTGVSALASVLSLASKRSNIVVVTAMGNQANVRTHFLGTVISNTEPVEIEINVGANERGFAMELWANTLDVLSVSVTSPSGESIPRIPARDGQSNIYRFLLEGTELSIDYRIVEPLSGVELIFFRFIGPTEGLWKVNVYRVSNIEGKFNVWLPIKSFLTGETFFIQSNPSVTLTEPAADGFVISVGGYDHVTGADYIDSGRGYTSSGRVKPDIVAPAVNVYGPKAGGGFTRKSGTSVAVAHVAGAAALLLTWGVYFQNEPLIGTSGVKYILVRGAIRDDNREYPNNISGYGKLNLINAFYELRET